MIVSFWGEVFTSFPIQYEIVIAVQYFHIVIAMGTIKWNKKILDFIFDKTNKFGWGFCRNYESLKKNLADGQVDRAGVEGGD